MNACHLVTLEQLLSIRDGEPVDARVSKHVESCELCTKELARTRDIQSALRALPIVEPPPFNKEALRNHDHASSSSRFSSRHVTTLAASIGALAVAIAMSYAVHNRSDMRDLSDTNQTSNNVTSLESNEAPAKSWVIRSQDLDSRLRYLPSRPHVQRVSTAATIESLQSRIQWVDYQLSLADDVGLTERQSAQLWQDRVQLMDTLVKVRSAEAQRFAALQ